MQWKNTLTSSLTKETNVYYVVVDVSMHVCMYAHMSSRHDALRLEKALPPLCLALI